MRLVQLVGLGVALALVSTSALGFEEQKAAAPEASQPEAPAAAVAGDAGSAPAAKAEGTEVRIPGLGKLGVLPKMDFGLELLYGANEPKAPTEDREIPADDLTIRGSVKKTF